jgi:hypothetical protein
LGGGRSRRSRKRAWGSHRDVPISYRIMLRVYAVQFASTRFLRLNYKYLPDRLSAYSGFQDRCLKPLGHLSAVDPRRYGLWLQAGQVVHKTAESTVRGHPPVSPGAGSRC